MNPFWNKGDFNVTVRNCARCGKDHVGMTFHQLSNPTDEWKYWGTCWKTKQPVLLKIETVPDESNNR